MILAWFLQAILSVAVRERNVLLMRGNPSARDFGCHLSWQDGSGWQGTMRELSDCGSGWMFRVTLHGFRAFRNQGRSPNLHSN